MGGNGKLFPVGCDGSFGCQAIGNVALKSDALGRKRLVALSQGREPISGDGAPRLEKDDNPTLRRLFCVRGRKTDDIAESEQGND